MAMRLVLTAAVFFTAIVLNGINDTAPIERGLYLALAVAFFSAACLGFIAKAPSLREHVLWAQIPIDVGIITGLVHFSGGSDSIFIFLYALVPVYSATVLGSRGAFSSFAGGSLSYGALLLCYHQAVLGAATNLGPKTGRELLMSWLLQTGLQLFVTALASNLSREVQDAGAELDQRTEDLDQLRGLHERTVASLMSGLLTTDLEGKITSFNAEAGKITGWDAEEAVGRELDEVIPGTQKRVMEASRGRRDERARIVYETAEGETLHLGIAGSVLRDRVGQPKGYVMIFQDITGVVGMEDELRRQERLAAVGALAAGLAHEIRNPLAAISGSVQMLEEQRLAQQNDEEQEGNQLMTIVVREADRLSRLIEDFLTFARPAPVKLEKVSVGEMVKEVLVLMEPTRPKSIVFEKNLVPGLEVWADSSQLRQVLWNLVLNACQAMPDGGRLRISAEVSKEISLVDRNSEGGGVPMSTLARLSVEDTGVGIETDELDKIFDPFFTKKPNGSGLGLAMSHRMIDSMGGVLKVTSSVGQGTEMLVLLPMVEESE
ncbi:MAG: PAS domain S-box protein [Deltaproteobacteria bacterium]|nr:PAS domain S-box protein [Deltaproteobacteria bacterium]